MLFETDRLIKHWENETEENLDTPLAKIIVDISKVVFTKALDKGAWNNSGLAKEDLAEDLVDLKNRTVKTYLFLEVQVLFHH